jgi:hypothetical protein
MPIARALQSERADVLRRRFRGGSSNPIVYVLGFESFKKLAGERDSNPRRAFDPYTLSRADHQSIAVNAIMEFCLFIVMLSTVVHSRLWKTFRTVPYG